MKNCKALSWLSVLYFVEGLPNAIVASLSVGFYKSMGMDNASIAMLTSFLYLPWVIKGFWGPLVDSYSQKRKLIFDCAGGFFICFLGLALAQFSEHWVFLTACIFWLLGFISATFDISADGFYMLALTSQEQSFYVGIRNAFYRVAVLFGQGAMLAIAGYSKELFGGIERGWAVSFGICALVMGVGIFVLKLSLPHSQVDVVRTTRNVADILRGIVRAFKEFFTKKNIFCILAFVIFYRFAEAQLLRIVQPFFMDSIQNGGLGMSETQVGFVYGTVAPIALLGGGILGGMLISKIGLVRCMLIMACALNLPNLIYVYMAMFQPQDMLLNSAFIAIEQFGYGFGFSGFMVFLMWASKGENQTSSYAICTSLMALGIVLPGCFSGAIQMSVGYVGFFEWIMVSTLVSFAVTIWAVKTVKKSGGY